ncbi:MAG: ATP synthase subunit I [Syntrophobacterales bacterium]|jgi:hypothetical protein|nr:ATP synthase subunit I [Syntrophobacterales bacterium]
MREATLSDIERLNAIVLLLGSVMSAVIMREFKHFFSFAVGSSMMVLNFRFLRKIIEGGFSNPNISKKEVLIKLPVKFLILVALVTVVIVFGDVSVTFFLIGLSTVFISIVINQVLGIFSPATKRRQKNGA